MKKRRDFRRLLCVCGSLMPDVAEVLSPKDWDWTFRASISILSVDCTAIQEGDCQESDGYRAVRAALITSVRPRFSFPTRILEPNDRRHIDVL